MAKQKKRILTPQQNGQWSKKIAGKVYYFGTDYEKAVKRYLAERDGLIAGHERKRSTDAATLKELGNLYFDWSRKRVSSGDYTDRSLGEAIATVKRLLAIRGEDSQPAHWAPTDYADIKEAFFQPIKRTAAIRGGVKGPSVDRRSASTVDGDIRRIKAFLKWCADSELMPAPRFGKSFNQSSVKQQRLARIEFGKRDLEPAAIAAVLAHCSPYLKPLVLLGINGAFGASDLAQLTLGDYDGEWLDFARRKTGVERKVWLWPETRAAIDGYLAIRQKPFGAENEQLLFTTKHRQPWQRDSQDAIGKAFLKSRRAASVSRGTFYDLRRTFQTIAEGCLDFPAVSHVMGHAASTGDMSAKYRQRITDERIKAVCEHVRGWLFS